MEHNTSNIRAWHMPQEINELICSFLTSVADLFRWRATSKDIRTSLSHQRLWKAICLQEFDLEFVDDKSNWIELASKYGAMKYNIRKGRVLVQALAVNRISTDRVYTGESYILDDTKVVVNWLRTIGSGSNSRDITDHSAILNINTRKEEQSIHLEKHRSVVVLGNKLAELNWSGYAVRPVFDDVKVSERSSDGSKTFEHHLPTKDTHTVLSNADPAKRNLVVLVDTQSEGNIMHVILNVHDLNELRLVKSFSVKNFSRQYYYYGPTNVIFHGDSIYALCTESKVLHIFNVTSDDVEGDQIPLPIDGSIDLLGVHRSLLFGFSRENEQKRSGLIWLYDLNSKKLRFYKEMINNPPIIRLLVYCGTLVLVSGDLMRFIDYRSDPTQLTLINVLQLDDVNRTSVHSMNDGKLLMSGYHSGIKLVDFEHAHDRCEILCVKKTIKGRKSKSIAIKAHELVSRAKELLGTHEFISRYIKMSEKQRFGIIYRKKQQNVNEVSLLAVNALIDKKPEYNTPYMYHTMIDLSELQDRPRIIWAVPPPTKKFFGKVIIFYEEFDGTRWKLSKPEHWITEKSEEKIRVRAGSK